MTRAQKNCLPEKRESAPGHNLAVANLEIFHGGGEGRGGEGGEVGTKIIIHIYNMYTHTVHIY